MYLAAVLLPLIGSLLAGTLVLASAFADTTKKKRLLAALLWFGQVLPVIIVAEATNTEKQNK